MKFYTSDEYLAVIGNYIAGCDNKLVLGKAEMNILIALLQKYDSESRVKTYLENSYPMQAIYLFDDEIEGLLILIDQEIDYLKERREKNV